MLECRALTRRALAPRRVADTDEYRENVQIALDKIKFSENGFHVISYGTRHIM